MNSDISVAIAGFILRMKMIYTPNQLNVITTHTRANGKKLQQYEFMITSKLKSSVFMYNKSVFGIFFILIIFGSINSFGRIDDANLISIIQRDSILKSNRREVLNFFSYGENILKKYGAKAAVDSLLQFENTFANSKDFGRKAFTIKF